MRGRRAAAVLLVLSALTGCTLWKEKRPPTWQSATGAEQHERLLWQEIKAGNWTMVERQLAATFSAVVPGRKLDRAEMLEYLRSLGIREAVVGEAEVRPNGNDMVVSFRLDLETQAGPRRFLALTVWQQSGQGWTAVAHAQTAAE